MEQLRKKYVLETNNDVFANYSRGEYGGYTNKYVEWLEKCLMDLSTVHVIGDSFRNVAVQSHGFYVTGKLHRYVDKEGETFALVELDSGRLQRYSMNDYWLEFLNDS